MGDNGAVRRSSLLAALAVTAASVAMGPWPRPAVAATAEVGMVTGDRYDPPVVSIAAGDSVTWTHRGGTAHTVTFEDGSPGSPDPMTPTLNNTFTRTFPTPGVTYKYVCRYHSSLGMRGEVVVRATAPATTAAPPPTTAATTTTTRPRSTTTTTAPPAAGPGGGAPPPLALPLDPVPTSTPPPSPFGTTPTTNGAGTFLPPLAGQPATGDNHGEQVALPTRRAASRRSAATVLAPLGLVVAAALGGLAFRRARDRRALETW